MAAARAAVHAPNGVEKEAKCRPDRGRRDIKAAWPPRARGVAAQASHARIPGTSVLALALGQVGRRFGRGWLPGARGHRRP
ncbi:hypothetical protein, partial [Xanthomonas sp. SHU 199]|uniref:hypothetical protein n=1 Tax=Xanthomonas sp. SHU 199 TaxID=1591174 RepID=UPI001E2B85D4